MKTLLHSFIKIIGVWILLATLFIPKDLHAQQIIETVEGDTLVTITPDQVRTINVIFQDHKLLTEKSLIQCERISLMESRIQLSDSIIFKQGDLIKDLQRQMVLQEKAEAALRRKEKTKYFLIGGATGVIVGTLVTFLLCK